MLSGVKGLNLFTAETAEHVKKVSLFWVIMNYIIQFERNYHKRNEMQIEHMREINSSTLIRKGRGAWEVPGNTHDAGETV